MTRTPRFDCGWASPLAPPPPGSRPLSVLPRRPAFPRPNRASVARKSSRVACVLVKRGDYLIDLFARRQTFCYYSIGDSFHAQGAEQLHVTGEVRWMRNAHTADGNPSSNE